MNKKQFIDQLKFGNVKELNDHQLNEYYDVRIKQLKELGLTPDEMAKDDVLLSIEDEAISVRHLDS